MDKKVLTNEETEEVSGGIAVKEDKLAEDLARPAVESAGSDCRKNRPIRR